MTDVTALVLAAGAGRRYGGPKALARSDDGVPWLTTVTATLASAGLESVVVVPTSYPGTADLLAPGARALFVDTFTEGIGASLRAGLSALAPTSTRAVLVALVDQPTLPLTVVARILTPTPAQAADEEGRDAAVLRRAVFDGRPGHPVLIGRAHWAALMASLSGDDGAGPYLREHRGERVECADLWDGADIDQPGTSSSPA